jgi:inner membrane protein
MDNVCHTLAGAALAEAGLRRRAPLAVPALLIGANLPDLDAFAYLRDPLFALTFRRGWTHGVLALALWPLVLAAALIGSARLALRRGGRTAGPAEWRALLLVAGAAVLSHPLLDLLNSYGVRLLMPFSSRWFYADTLFIVDPWLWLTLGAGVFASARRRKAGAPNPERPARLALGVAGGYVAAMLVAGLVARGIVQREAEAAGIRIAREMVAPAPVTPFRREVLLDLGGRYRRGEFEWIAAPHLRLGAPLPQGFETPGAREALSSAPARAFLGWSRFPAAQLDPRGRVVRLYDLRYADAGGPSWAAVEIAGEERPQGARGAPQE